MEIERGSEQIERERKKDNEQIEIERKKEMSEEVLGSEMGCLESCSVHFIFRSSALLFLTHFLPFFLSPSLSILFSSSIPSFPLDYIRMFMVQRIPS